MAGLGLGGDPQGLPETKNQRLRLGGQFADAGRGQHHAPPEQFDRSARLDVGGVEAFAPQHAIGLLGGDAKQARSPPAVDEPEFVIDGHALDQIAQDGKNGVNVRVHGHHRARAVQPDLRGGDRRAASIPFRLEMGHARPGFDGAGAQFGAGEVHENPAGRAQFFFRAAKMPDDVFPRPGFIMGAVDARHVHAGRHQVTDDLVVVRRLGGHGHHDADRAFSGRRTKEQVGMAAQFPGASCQIHGSSGARGERSGRGEQPS